MVTGEGKTLVATLPAYLNALEGKGVHVVTVNDYLARRDMEWMGPLYMGLGLTVGAIQSGMESAERQKAVRLRHHLRHEQRIRLRLSARQHAARPPATTTTIPKHVQQAQGPLHFAIIDEVDNILIDEARTPLIISGPAHDDVTQYSKADKLARQLKKDVHFEVKEKEHTVDPDRRRRSRGRTAGRRGKLLHGRQHGMAAPDRQLAQGPSPLQARRELRRRRTARSSSSTNSPAA